MPNPISPSSSHHRFVALSSSPQPHPTASRPPHVNLQAHAVNTVLTKHQAAALASTGGANGLNTFGHGSGPFAAALRSGQTSHLSRKLNLSGIAQGRRLISFSLADLNFSKLEVLCSHSTCTPTSRYIAPNSDPCYLPQKDPSPCCLRGHSAADLRWSCVQQTGHPPATPTSPALRPCESS